MPSPMKLQILRVLRNRDAVHGRTAARTGDSQRTASREKPGRRRVALTREGLCYVLVLCFVFLGALIRDINLLMLLFGLLAGMLLYSVWYVRFALRRIQVVRQLPERMVCGQPSEVGVLAKNPRRWLALWSVAIEDRVVASGPLESGLAGRAGLLAWHIRPKRQQRHAYTFCPPTRGRFTFGPLAVVTRFPLGLVRGSRQLSGGQTVLAWPAMGRLGPRARRWIGHGDRSTSQSKAGRAGRLGEFHSLRDWRPGDSPRWVHWRTTARVGELMVRQFEQHRDPEFALLLDLWQPGLPSEADRAAVEAAVSFAATLLTELCRRRGARISVLLPPATPLCVHRQATPALTTPLLDELATAPVHATEFDKVLEAGSGAVRPGVPTLLVTTRDSDAATLRATQMSRHDPRQLAWLRGVEIVAARSPSFADYLSMPTSGDSTLQAGMAPTKPVMAEPARQHRLVSPAEARANE